MAGSPLEKPSLRVRRPEPQPVPRLAGLLDAAESIFIAKGYHTATMNEVARAAGMSKKTVYALVESKAALFDALLAHHQDRFQFPDPLPGQTVNETLTADLLCLARFLLSDAQIAIVRLIMAEYTKSPELGRMFVQNRVTRAKAQLEDRLAALRGDSDVSDADVKELTAMLFGMTVGEFHLAVLVGFRAPPSRVALEKRVKRAVDIFLAGCCAR
jgi:AcrR family transcriptional regulator